MLSVTDGCEYVSVIMARHPAGLSKKELWKLSGISNLRLNSLVSKMLRTKELIYCSGRLVLNNPECIKAFLLEMSIQNIRYLCYKIGIETGEIKEDKLKDWINSYVDGMEWKNGKLVSKLEGDFLKVADLYNIMEVLA